MTISCGHGEYSSRNDDLPIEGRDFAGGRRRRHPNAKAKESNSSGDESYFGLSNLAAWKKRSGELGAPIEPSTPIKKREGDDGQRRILESIVHVPNLL
ncbi:MAG: hypothetical protein M3O46_12515 [Myxococcota bacterium]|nr:hypothetical protein [Myxococcota bacterium]